MLRNNKQDHKRLNSRPPFLHTVNPRIKAQGKTKISINFKDQWNL